MNEVIMIHINHKETRFNSYHINHKETRFFLKNKIHNYGFFFREYITLKKHALFRKKKKNTTTTYETKTAKKKLRNPTTCTLML